MTCLQVEGNGSKKNGLHWPSGVHLYAPAAMHTHGESGTACSRVYHALLAPDRYTAMPTRTVEHGGLQRPYNAKGLVTMERTAGSQEHTNIQQHIDDRRLGKT